ncbi:type II secretion system protein GspL [Maricaulaceae bacterium EIL42A08]|nr:type II secretion system protein GspL [Maricaulaceae bacterium EIL42A08]
MRVLVLTLPAEATATQAGWALVEGDVVLADGEIASGEEPRLPGGGSADHAVALAPAESVFLRRAPVPGANDRDAARAAPFLIEEQLAQPLEDVETAIGPAAPDGARFVGAVDKELLASWRRFALGLGIKPVHLVPDAFVLPDVGADLVAFEYGARVLARTRSADVADGGGARDVEAALAEPVAISLDTDLAEALLPALANHLAPKRVLVSEGLNPNLAAPDAEPVALKRVPAPDLRVLAAQSSAETLASLPALFGAGLMRALDWAGLLKPWRGAAILAAILVLGTAIFAAGEAAYLERRASAYASAEQDAFRNAFPDTRIVDTQVQLRRALASVGAVEDSAGFLDLAAALARIVDGNDDVRVDSIRYDADRGVLSVSALYAGFDDFEALRVAADAEDVILEDGGARQSANGVEGAFTVRLP